MMEFVDEVPLIRISGVVGQRRKGRKRPRVALTADQMERWTLDDEGELIGAPGTESEGRCLGIEARLSSGATQRIHLIATSCHYGGVRLWFMCPKCGRRTATLYCVGAFACRKCHALYHRCEAENPGRRSLLYVAGAVLEHSRRRQRIHDYFSERYTTKAAERRILKALVRLKTPSLMREFNECRAKDKHP